MIKKLILGLILSAALTETAFSGTTNTQVPGQEFIFSQITTPSNPASGKNKVYSKSGDKLFYLNSSGTEKQVNKITDLDSTGCGTGTYPSSDGVGGVTCATPASAPDHAYGIQNVGFTATVSGNALTVALKQKDASTNCSGGSPCNIAFRSSTLTSGLYNFRSVTGALSVVGASGASFGTTSAIAQYIYVYAIDNAGAVELALSGSRDFDEGSLYTTTTIGAGSTSAFTLYSTTGRSSVPIRYIGRIVVNEATAGTYASAPTEIDLDALYSANRNFRSEVRVNTYTGTGSTNTGVIRFTNNTKNTGPDITYATSATLGDTFTIASEGLYCASFWLNGNTGSGNASMCLTLNATTLTSSDIANGAESLACSAFSGAAEIHTYSQSYCGWFKPGDIIRAQTSFAPSTSSNCGMGITKMNK